MVRKQASNGATPRRADSPGTAHPAGKPLLAVHSIECRYRRQVALREFSVAIGEGDLCCLMGPSGCGKTTALRAIAGLEPIHRGSIRMGQRLLSSTQSSVPPEKRRTGMVFQENTLFPHLNVRDNIGFGLHRLGARRRNAEIDQLIELVRLNEVSDQAYPHELSGGQQQRVALARALATRPRILLMDEPFSNLDAQLRRDINLKVRALLKQRTISAILVTHDQEEGFAFSDYMGVLRDGSLQQWDSAYKLYHEPSNRFVAQFVGQGTFIPGRINTDYSVDTAIGQFRQTDRQHQHKVRGEHVDVLVRPDDIIFSKDSRLKGEIRDKVFAGDRTLYTLTLGSGTTVQSLMPSHLDFEPGSRIGITTDLEHVIIFPRKDTL